jgi:outer membrane protein assembly factor BamB
MLMSCAEDVFAGTQSTGSLAGEILRSTGVKGGVIVHVGCENAGLTAALCAGDGYLVHALDKDAQNVKKARCYIRARGIYGQVSVDQWPGSVLPYNDNTVNLLVAENVAAVSEDEILRVLCPNGVARVRSGHGWKHLHKPRPPDIDEWTHFLHDATGNAVAHDRRVGSPRRIQWTAGPQRSRDHDALASLSAMTSSNGRLFYIFDEGHTSLIHRPPKWRLIARDAFNGLLLWKRDIPTWVTHLFYFRTGPVQMSRRLVSVADNVYATLGFDAPISKLDAATGKTRLVYGKSKRTEEIVYHDGVLLATIGEPNIMNEEAPKVYGYWELSVHETPKVDKSIVAYEADSGDMLWRKTGGNLRYLVPLSLGAHRDRAFYLDNQHLHCIDLKSGHPKWSAPFSTEGLFLRNYAPTVVAHDDVIMCLTWNRLCCFSLLNGEKRWENKGAIGFASPGDLFAIDGLAWTIPMTASVWRGNKLGADGKIKTGIDIPRENFLGNGGEEIWGMDIHTGEVKRSLPRMELLPGGHHHRCYRNKATDRYLICGRRGLEYLDLLGGNHVNNWWLRGECQYGVMPANGLIYIPPDPCRCFNLVKLNGLLALSAGNSLDGADGADGPELEKGPAYSAVSARQERIRNTAPEPLPKDAAWQPPVRGPRFDEWPTY